MARPEDKALGRLADALKELGCVTKKMHGNLFQDGVPDLLVVRPDGGGYAFAEAKFLRQKAPTLRQLQAELRPGQRKSLHDWGRERSAPYWVFAGWAYEEKSCFCVPAKDFPPLLQTALDVPLEPYTVEEAALWIARGTLVTDRRYDNGI